MHMIKNIKNRLPIGVFKFIFNLWPPLLGAGIKMTTLSADYRSATVTLKLKWFNINYVGTHFGGSIFAMTDPFYMFMLVKNLGDDYIVWDKAANINFIKPGRSTLTAKFNLTQDIINTVLEKTSTGDKYIFDLPVDVIDADNITVATVIRTLYVRKKWDHNTKPQ